MGDLMYLEDGRVFYYEILGFSWVDQDKITRKWNGED
jgi:hypothetical protein